MGWVLARERKSGTSYHAYTRDLQGLKVLVGTYSIKKDAIKAWQDREAKQRSGIRVGNTARGRQSFSDFVELEWWPNARLELTTREGYRYLLDKRILPALGKYKLLELMPNHLRAWIAAMERDGVRPPSIAKCKTIVDSVLTTAFNDQITAIHAGRGVKTPPVPRKRLSIITAEQFDDIHRALEDPGLQLLVETDIETGLRWGELTELRPRDIDFATGVLTVSRAVVHLRATTRPTRARFVVKQYPKDREHRSVRLADHLVEKLRAHVRERGLGTDELLFVKPDARGVLRRSRPSELPDPLTLGRTAVNDKGRTYSHGTMSAYNLGKCRCRFCRDAAAVYRSQRRAAGKDVQASGVRATVPDTGHIGGDWFRKQVWSEALTKAGIDVHVTPHGLRHAHASWLLAGGADLETVRERLGHGSILTTQRYLHALPGAQNAALTALGLIRGHGAVEPAVPDAKSDSAKDRELAELRAVVQKFKALLSLDASG